MVTIEFDECGIKTEIQTNEKITLNDIINKFCLKTKKNKDEIIFIYGGNIIDEKKTFVDLANSQDKERKKASIIIFNTNSSSNKNKKLSKYIICPTCSETTRFNINNFKIKLFDCVNKHVIDNLSFSNFNNTQLIDESKIICEICEKRNKAEAYQNLFYICKTCNKNMCPLCNSTHDKNHNRIEYGQKYFKCNLHNDFYFQYCKDCKQNICLLCEKDHNNHNVISLGSVMPDINKLNENKNELRSLIDKYKVGIQEIKNKLDDDINDMEAYYTLYLRLVEGYEIQNRNYQVLQNLNDLNKYNDDLLKNLKGFNDEENIHSKLAYLLYLYSDKNEYNISNTEEIEKLKSEYENKLNEIQNKYDELKAENENNNKIIIKELENGKYEGQMKNNKLEGKGKYYYNNGSIYEGEWKNDKKEGKGIFIFPNGDRYEGDFKDDNFDGKGVFLINVSSMKPDKYEGEFKNGQKNGKGIHYYKNGNKYEGEYKNNQKEGKGVFYFIDGNRYDGEFKDGKANGKGIYYFNDGNIYNGEWKNDKKEGKGICYYANGNREMGDYLNNTKIGKHITLTIYGEVITNYYNYGMGFA